MARAKRLATYNLHEAIEESERDIRLHPEAAKSVAE
jgi:hypothetical protein